MARQYYVGYLSGGKREGFQSSKRPTPLLYPQYLSVAGPYSTKEDMLMSARGFSEFSSPLHMKKNPTLMVVGNPPSKIDARLLFAVVVAYGLVQAVRVWWYQQS